jgi:hypothetical protein
MSLSKFKFNLFVSYSSKNENEVDQLCKLLRNEKYILWIDKEQAIYGDLEKIMEKGIDDSECFLCCLSTSYSQGKIHYLNITMLLHKAKKLYSLLLKTLKETKKEKKNSNRLIWVETFFINMVKTTVLKIF